MSSNDEDGGGTEDAQSLPFTHGAAQTAPTSSIATAMMFGTIIFATTSLASKTWLTGDMRAITTAFDPRSSPLDITSYQSLYTLLHHFSILGLILLFAYICEYHPPFPHAEKSYDRDEFFFLTAILFVASAYTVHRNDGKDDAAIMDGEDKKDDDNNSDGGHAGHGHHGPTKGFSGGWSTTSASHAGSAGKSVASGGGGSKAGGSRGGGGDHSTAGGDATAGGGDEDEASLDTVGTPKSGFSRDDDDSLAGTVKSTSDPLAFLQTRTTATTATGRIRRGRRGELQSARTGYRMKPVAEAVEANDVLSRDQTEEWKGWMQFIFLLYHYYSAVEVYNSIRIMITCYVWMTGFGNFSFFYLKGDYSSVRVLQMLWRLNFLVIFLMLSQGTTYILYYICPLHTYFFLMVYFTMRLGKDLNYRKFGIRLKLMFVACLIYAFWDVESPIFKLAHMAFLGEKPILGATGGAMWEWYFRTTLDHWSTFLGMVFALNFPITSLFFRKLEAHPTRSEWLAKGIVGVALFGCFVAWVIGPFQEGKLQYNSTNAYFGFIPLITYIYFRNLTPTLREYSLDLLHQIGKTTLETYLMQHHIWLTSNAKSLLTIIPGWPRVNMLLVTFVYFFTSRRLYKLTLYLRGMLLPNNRSACIKSLMCLFATIGAFYAMALTLESYGYASLTAVAIICVVCGLIVYQTVVDASWDQYRKTAPLTEDDDQILVEGTDIERPNFESSITRITPPIFGAMALFVLGLTWHGMAEAGAGKIQPLPTHCEAFANDGQWIPVDGCNEGMRGEALRKYDTVSFATCGNTGGAYIWGWNMTDPSMYCRFARRESRQLKRALNKRRLVFIGDSMTRNMYHAMMRALGVDGSGGYDATGPKHADISNEIGTINVDFQWAPLASDQLGAMKSMNRKVAKGGKWERGFPDLIIVGGGAWDRLHQFATDEDQDALKDTLRELKKEIIKIEEEGAPVSWLVPTTINDRALNTEEKRDHMTELDMEDMRDIYADMGVLSACSFVVEGPVFTKARKKESYDGVHYPPQVYDAGAQILANAMDWLLPKRDDIAEDFVPLQPGKMANPYLGLMMLCFIFVGLMFFDGFLGFSYLACICARGVMPNDLFEEAFTTLHNKANLPLEGILSDQITKSGFATKGARSGFGARKEFGRSDWKSKYADKYKERETSYNDTSYERTDTGVSNTSSMGGGDDAQSVRSRRSVQSADSVDDEIAALLGRK